MQVLSAEPEQCIQNMRLPPVAVSKYTNLTTLSVPTRQEMGSAYGMLQTVTGREKLTALLCTLYIFHHSPVHGLSPVNSQHALRQGKRMLNNTSPVQQEYMSIRIEHKKQTLDNCNTGKCNTHSPAAAHVAAHVASVAMIYLTAQLPQILDIDP